MMKNYFNLKYVIVGLLLHGCIQDENSYSAGAKHKSELILEKERDYQVIISFANLKINMERYIDKKKKERQPYKNKIIKLPYGQSNKRNVARDNEDIKFWEDCWIRMLSEKILKHLFIEGYSIEKLKDDQNGEDEIIKLIYKWSLKYTKTKINSRAYFSKTDNLGIENDINQFVDKLVKILEKPAIKEPISSNCYGKIVRQKTEHQEDNSNLNIFIGRKYNLFVETDKSNDSKNITPYKDKEVTKSLRQYYDSNSFSDRNSKEHYCASKYIEENITTGNTSVLKTDVSKDSLAKYLPTEKSKKLKSQKGSRSTITIRNKPNIEHFEPKGANMSIELNIEKKMSRAKSTVSCDNKKTHRKKVITVFGPQISRDKKFNKKKDEPRKENSTIIEKNFLINKLKTKPL